MRHLGSGLFGLLKLVGGNILKAELEWHVQRGYGKPYE
jgi:hypothetical protein